MTSAGQTQRTLRAHLERTAQSAVPAMRAGIYESVTEFLAVTESLHSLDPAQLERFEPSRGNAWLTPAYAAAIAYLDSPSDAAGEYPFTLAVYVEGDVTAYRFQRFADATRAGRLWAAGDPSKTDAVI